MEQNSRSKCVSGFRTDTVKKFNSAKKIPIGFYPGNKKDHKFDIAAEDNSMAIECKRYAWTVMGNVPSAKMGFTNEAAFYLSFLPESYEKHIVMLYSYNAKRDETLAEYYYRMNKHLLGSIKVAEYDPGRNKLRIIGRKVNDKSGLHGPEGVYK